MRQRHKHAHAIIAWAEGKDIQVWDEDTKRWHDIVGKFPLFNEDRGYRIKPPANKYRAALFKYHNIGAAVSVANNEEDGEFFELSPRFVRWLTDWVEYEE